MRLKKPWSKPELRPVRVSDQYDPADGLTRAQWEAARDLQRRAAKSVADSEEAREATKADADALH